MLWHAENIDEIDQEDVSEDMILVLPLGATEQHGGHLPAETDTIIADGIAERLMMRLGNEFPAVFLSARATTYSPEHADYPGTRTLSYGDAIEDWCRIGASASDIGIRRMLLLNAHGGNSPLMAIAAQEMRVRHDMLCVATSWTRHGDPARLVGAEEKSFGIHAGDIETSVMLALAPERVDMEEARNFPNLQQELAKDFRLLRAYGPHAFGWKMQDLCEGGATGNATAASREKGEALLEEAVAGLAELMLEIRRFDLTLLKGPPNLSSPDNNTPVST